MSAELDARTTVSVNGEPRALAPGTTVAQLVTALCGSGERAARGIAVALDREVVPRSSWESVVLRPGDRVEVVSAVAGG